MRSGARRTGATHRRRRPVPRARQPDEGARHHAGREPARSRRRAACRSRTAAWRPGTCRVGAANRHSRRHRAARGAAGSPAIRRCRRPRPASAYGRALPRPYQTVATGSTTSSYHMGKTLLQKVWDLHTVRHAADRADAALHRPAPHPRGHDARRRSTRCARAAGRWRVPIARSPRSTTSSRRASGRGRSSTCWPRT